MTTPSPKLKIAVITGGHGYDVPAFTALFQRWPDIENYPYAFDQWIAESEAVRLAYDSVVYYQFALPEAPSEAAQKVLRASVEQGQGVVVLHHALLCYTDWPFWSELVGIANRKFYPPSPKNQHLPVRVVDPSHPITRALGDYEMVDEIFLMDDTLSADGNTRLLETQPADPKGQRAIAWTRQVERSRVFCLQSGHDAVAFNHPKFIEVLGRGIRWTATEAPAIPASAPCLKTLNGKVVLHSEPVPVCGPRHLLCQTLYSTVTNGTERSHLIEFKDKEGIQAKAGYQHVGRVREVGRLVSGYEVGDLIFSGRHQGHNPWFVENLDDGNPLFIKLAPDANLIEAALLGMASIGMHDVRRAATRLGDRVVVVGAGPIGQFVCQAARLSGAATVICDLDPGRLEIARKAGAEETVLMGNEQGWEQLYSMGPFDIVFETSGAPVLDRLLGNSWADPKLIRRQGKISLVALRPEIRYPHMAGHAVEAEIHHISHFKFDDLKNVCRFWKYGALSIAPIIQDVLPIAEAPAFYDQLLENPASTFGTVFDWSAVLNR